MSTPALSPADVAVSTASVMLFLQEAAKLPMQMSDGVIFMLAAGAELRGSPVSQRVLADMASVGVNFCVAGHGKCRLTAPYSTGDDSLGWLHLESGQTSAERLLRLTAVGRAVLDGAVLAAQPFRRG